MAARRAVHFHLREEYEALNAARARMSDPALRAALTKCATETAAG
jgi:hypothetical protein